MSRPVPTDSSAVVPVDVGPQVNALRIPNSKKADCSPGACANCASSMARLQYGSQAEKLRAHDCANLM